MTTNAKSQGRFWRRIVIFTLPFAVPFLLLTGCLVYMGESMPLAWVVGHQQAGEALYRPRYGNRDLQFKTLSVNMRQPEVLALGSSRILQFRAGFLTEQPDAFYNAAAPAWTLDQLDALVAGIEPGHEPEALILAVDAPWFNDAYLGDVFPPTISDFAHIFQVNRSLAQDFIAGDRFTREGFDPMAYLTRTEPGSGGLALGMRAIRDGHGFRSDGSEQYGDFLIGGWLYQPTERERHLDWLRKGEEMYVYGDVPSEARLAQFEELVQTITERGIDLIIYAPPYTTALWDEMVADGHHGYVQAALGRVAQIAADYGVPFYDLSRAADIGAGDEEFFDGWHGSERVTLRAWLRIVEGEPELLGPYVDADTLRQIIAEANDTWDVFGMDNVPGTE